MALSAAAIKNAKGRTKPYKLTDGDGLFLYVAPSGGRYWRLGDGGGRSPEPLSTHDGKRIDRWIRRIRGAGTARFRYRSRRCHSDGCAGRPTEPRKTHGWARGRMAPGDMMTLAANACPSDAASNGVAPLARAAT